MELNQLTPSQIVLLTLLVSFVTSIATGIVTVTLMEQAPPTIAQTVNRVVERTVEKIVPSGQTAGAAVTEKTVIVNESDQIARAVEVVTPSVIRLYSQGKDADGKDAQVFLGFGVVASKEGMIVTDTAVLPAGGVLTVVLADGSHANARVVAQAEEAGLAFLQGSTSTAEGVIQWVSATFADKKPALGEVVVGVSGKNSTRIGDGIVTAIPTWTSSTSPSMLETNVPAGVIAFGSVLVNVQGVVEGMSTAASRAVSENVFLASESIQKYRADPEVQASSEKKPS